MVAEILVAFAYIRRAVTAVDTAAVDDVVVG